MRTWEEVGRELGISPTWAQRIGERALVKLKRAIEQELRDFKTHGK